MTAILALGVAAIAGAATTTVRVGTVIATFGGTASPKKLPKNKYAPVTTNIFGKIKTSDGKHPPAMRETIVDIDKDVKLNVKGYPVCKAGQLQARDTKAANRVCGKTVLGKGIAHAQISFPEQKPIVVASPITIFNGGGSAARTKLLIHTFLTVPVPAAIVTQVTIQKRGTGIHAIAKIPVIAGGSGSVLDFRFKVGKTFRYKGKKAYYSMAKCPDGKFKVKSQSIFKNEAKTEGQPAKTVIKGSLLVPCTPKG
ncbi:MAG: hypothetical protein WD404_07160 [Solirubrobacterales bacterium]